MADYILKEDGSKVLLEDGSGLLTELQSIAHIASGGAVFGGGASVSLTSLSRFSLRGGWLEGASPPLLKDDALKVEIQALLHQSEGGFIIGGSAKVNFGVVYTGRGLLSLPYTGEAIFSSEVDETETIFALILSAL